MNLQPGIIILISLVISKSTLAQDTTHEKLVDKYYPKAKQEAPLPKTEKVNPVTTTTAQPAPVNNAPVKAASVQATVTAPPVPPTEKVSPVTTTTAQPAPVNNAPVKAVTVQATVTAPPPPDEPAAPVSALSTDVAPVTQSTSQAQVQPAQINNQPGKINKTPIPNNTKTSTDNNKPASPPYRDTRLGSSSPLYNTYEKNNNGAGSITTNPNKG